MNVRAIYPDCEVCGDPVQFDKCRAYYEHEDTGDLVHVSCYEESVAETSEESATSSGTE